MVIALFTLERRIMGINRQPQSSADRRITSLLLKRGLVLLMLSAGLTAAANGQSQSASSVSSSSIHVTHVLGFQAVRRNVRGELTIDDNNLRFQRNGRLVAELSIICIQNVSVSQEDKQVGGVPLMLGKAAAPFEGGRVVSLFSLKKYDSVAVDYRDNRGGLHGAIFRLAKGQGETFKNALIAHGAHFGQSEDPVRLQNMPDGSVDAQKWGVEVDRVDPGATTLDPSFSNAIYENLLRALTKSKQFDDVLRSGDRNANDGVLVLKTRVEKYSPGSETRRAVTTVLGATKLKVRIQLVTRNGRVVAERVIDGNVRFMGDNLAATNKVAKKAAKLLKRSHLPTPAELMLHSTTVKEAATIL